VILDLGGIMDGDQSPERPSMLGPSWGLSSPPLSSRKGRGAEDSVNG